jgi:hypothetical protein
VPGSTGALLVSPFNMAWGCYEQAGSGEVLEFCLFLVVFPAQCVSSIFSKIFALRNIHYLIPSSSCHLGKTYPNLFNVPFLIPKLPSLPATLAFYLI